MTCQIIQHLSSSHLRIGKLVEFCSFPLDHHRFIALRVLKKIVMACFVCFCVKDGMMLKNLVLKHFDMVREAKLIVNKC